MRKLIVVLTALALAVSLCVPALAEETPDWNGPLGEGAAPTLCDTGRGYVLYYWYSTAVYYSEDGVAWTELTDRQWVKDAAGYFALGVGQMGHREFEFLWTGTEYMMRQSLLDDPRGTYKTVGDSPRNSMVTFLDEDFNAIGEFSLNGPVTAIRYDNGIYYATAAGTETAFSREEWAADEAPAEDGLELQAYLAAMRSLLVRATELLRTLLWEVNSPAAPLLPPDVQRNSE